MLKKENRLTKKKEFDFVFKRGRSSFNGLTGLKSADNGLPASRFGIIVSTKVSKKATDRNRIKRQIRGIIERRLSELKSGRDYLFIALPGILGHDGPDIERSINGHFLKLRLYDPR